MAETDSATISNLEIKISASSEDAVKKIRQLTKALKNLKDVSKIQFDVEGAEKLTKMLDKFKDIGKISIGNQLAKQIRSVAESVESISDDSLQKIERLTKALSDLKGVDLNSFRRAMNNMSNTGSGKSKSSSASGSSLVPVDRPSDSNFFKLQSVSDSWQSEAGNLVNTLKNLILISGKVTAVLVIIKEAVKKVVDYFKKLWKAAKKVVSVFKSVAKAAKQSFNKSTVGQIAKQFNNLKSSIGRIAFYRAIRSAIKYVTDALKEGAENAYWYSKNIGDATKYISEAYDVISSSNFKMSNQLGAAWATMIATIQPIITQIISLVTKAAEVVTQFFAILSGKSTYLKAIDYTKAWADETGKGSASAKEWKNQLMGFDEINRLEEPSDSSRGKSSDVPDYGAMFEEAEIVNDWMKDIRDAFENGEWAELGKILGEKFNSVIDSIEVADFGKKLGEKVSAAVSTAYNFLSTADFVNLGEKVATFMNNALNNINFRDLGALRMRLKTALWDVIYGAVVNTDWALVATKLSDYVLGALNELATWLEGLDPHEISGAISTFFGNLKKEEIKEALFTVLYDAIGLVFEVTSDLFPDGIVPALTKAIANIFSSIDVKALHNVFSYMLDRAMWGESVANFWWLRIDKSKYAGRDIVEALAEGVDLGAAVYQHNLKNDVDDPTAKTFSNMESTVSEMTRNMGLEITDFGSVVSSQTGSIGSSLSTTGNSFQNFSGTGLNAMSSLNSTTASNGRGIVGTLNSIINTAKSAWNWLRNVSSANIQAAYEDGSIYLQGFASGGFPEDGLFMANHGELVGQFANGRTAVANNEQITSGIADAVYSAFMTAFAQTGGNGNGNDRPVNIYLDGRQIATTTMKYQNQYARAAG